MGAVYCVKKETRTNSVLALALMTFITSTCAIADETVPPIRQFEIATVEQLGHEIFEQDQLAWKATDILRSQQTDSELKVKKLHGWIVDTFPDRSVVRFVHETEHGNEALCDVAFSGGAAKSCDIPADRGLTQDEQARYAATQLAASSVVRPCSEHYNFVVLHDPETDGWLAYALAATTQPGAVVYGGHYRFTISKDGKKLLRSDALSRGCLINPPPDPSKGKEVAMFFIQLVSNVPVETAVWLNLQHKMTIILGTPDRKLWQIADGHITAAGEVPPKP